MRVVELRLAYAWTCDECGRENFVGTVVETVDDPDLGEGTAMLTPDTVTCPHCGTEFETETPGEED